MKLAVLFDNFGPYHIARLNAAADVAEVLGVEFAAASHEYEWASETEPTRFERLTLFAGGSSQLCSTSHLRQEIGRAFDRFQPDAVAIPGWSGRLAFASLSWCIAAGVPAIAMSESTAADGQRASWKEAIKARCVAACAAGLAGGRRQRDYLVQLGMPVSRIFLGYDAVDNAHFAAGADAVRRDAEATRARLALPERYFLASARFVEKKNLDGLLRAFANYRDVCGPANPVVTPWDLVLLGDGPLRSDLTRLCRELGIDGNVHFPGFQQYRELPAFYGLASAFIHASRVEQWGLVVNEALASGLPLLVSVRCGCAAELLREGENGYGFDPDDQSAMTACMLQITQLSESDRIRMASRGEQIVEEFGPLRFADGLLRAAQAARAEGRPRHKLGSQLFLRTLLARAR